MVPRNRFTFSKTELKAGAAASRRANDQLLLVPWPRFRRAYEEFPRWHALALWTQGIVAMLDDVPSWLVVGLRKQCPAFMEQEARSPEPKLMALHLLEWIRNQEFGYAKRQGWLDALTFYGVRHPRSECAWRYWERFENGWKRRQPGRFPRFDEWWHRALREEISRDAGQPEVAKAVETYVGWNALLLWLRPLFRSGVVLPGGVASELERRCPGVLGGQNPGRLQQSQEKSRIWRRLTAWGRDHCLPKPQQADWHGAFLRRVRFHPRHVRLWAYGKYWAKEWPRNPASRYPSFRQWELEADRYVRPSPK